MSQLPIPTPSRRLSLPFGVEVVAVNGGLRVAGRLGSVELLAAVLDPYGTASWRVEAGVAKGATAPAGWLVVATPHRAMLGTMAGLLRGAIHGVHWGHTAWVAVRGTGWRVTVSPDGRQAVWRLGWSHDVAVWAPRGTRWVAAGAQRVALVGVDLVAVRGTAARVAALRPASAWTGRGIHLEGRPWRARARRTR